MRFSPANAREMAAKSAEARRNRHASDQQIPVIAPLIDLPSDSLATSHYANKLALAQDRLLDELLATDSAKDRAALSQAIKNLRETYHMETGKPKPGTIKPERVSSRQSVKQPSEPKLDTTGSVPPSGQTPQ